MQGCARHHSVLQRWRGQGQGDFGDRAGARGTLGRGKSQGDFGDGAGARDFGGRTGARVTLGAGKE